MRRLLLAVLLFVVAAGVVGESVGSTIVLKTAWAKKYRNQLSIDTKATILALNKGKEEDGDSHGGSRQNAVGLPMVAEILNGTAALQQAARDELKPGSDPEKQVYGAWRLWFEHPPKGGGTQCQTFSGNPPPICGNQAFGGADSSPSHSFEIHPVWAVNGKFVGRSSLVLTSDNQSVWKTDDAFEEYTGKKKILTVVRSATALTLTSISIKANYAELRVRVTKTKETTKRLKDNTVDGGFVEVDVLSNTDATHVWKTRTRLFYFRDSAPGDALDPAAVGDEFVVVGMPRINLDDVLKATEPQKNKSFSPVPFEFVVVALVKIL